MECKEYKRVFDQSSAIMVIVNPDYNVSAASKGFLEATLNERNTIIGSKIFDVFPKIGEYIEEVLINTMRGSFNKVLREKKPDTTPIVRYDIPNLDSEENGYDIRYWKTINTPIFDDENNVTYIKQIYVDVTNSAELATQLELEKGNLDEYKSAEKYIRNSFKQAPVPICVLRGPEHLFEMVNEEFLRVAGEKIYIGKPAREVLPELEGQEFFEILDRVYESEELYVGSEIPTTFQPEGQTNDETAERFVDFIYQVLYDAKGEKEGVFVIGIDVTEKVFAQRKLRESENILNQLLNCMPQKISHTDKAGEMIFFNQQWIDETENTKEELNGDGWLKTVHPDDEEETRQNWNEAVKSGLEVEGECRIINKKLGYRWNLYRTVPITGGNCENGENGEIKMWINTKTDIHDRKRQKDFLEKAVAERTEELRIAHDELIEQYKEIEKQKEKMEAFARISSHDLQEPLRKIQMFTGRLRTKEYQNLSEKGLGYFEHIENAAKRMQTLIEDLLIYSKVKNDGQGFEIVDLKQVIDEVELEYREVIEEKNATLEVVEICEASVIASQFRQLIRNLISNSLKYSKPDTPPHVVIKGINFTGDKFIKEKPSELKSKLKPEQKYCCISVEDNGIGFDPVYRERIFEVFQRLHNKNEYEGTGIGLAIVKEIVGNHQGVIIVESEPGRGTTFEIYLPVEE